MSRALLVLLLAVPVGTAGLARDATAQTLTLDAYGVRAGLSLDDDLVQLLVGGHADLVGFADDLRLRPLLTVGVGDDALTILAGGEVHWLVALEEESRFEPYVGGGIGLFHLDPDRGGSDTDAALLVTGGVDVPVERWWGWFAEGKFVIADEAVFRLEGGVNWKY